VNTVGEREVLSIVETLNEVCTMLLGHKQKVYTENKNLINLTTVSNLHKYKGGNGPLRSLFQI
jgi:hypothetical protein